MSDRKTMPAVHVRVTPRFLDRVDAVAERCGERRTDWVRRVLAGAVEHAEAAERMREEAQRRIDGCT